MRDRTVFIHANARQLLAALVASHALKRNSRCPERFDVELILAEDCRLLVEREGRRYLRQGQNAIWRNDDPQSFAPLRFSVPQLMDYQGRALVIGPAVFALADANELLEADMCGAAILARRTSTGGHHPLHWASSVMLLDCAGLGHWDLQRDLARIFDGKLDYRDWMRLVDEPDGVVASLDPTWNDIDHLGPDTRFLHNRRRRTQPWKTGLPADFTPQGTPRPSTRVRMARRIRSLVDGSSPTGYYRRHPDQAQEGLFFQLLGECLESGAVSEALLRREIAQGHVRPDAFRLAGSPPTAGAAVPPRRHKSSGTPA